MSIEVPRSWLAAVRSYADLGRIRDELRTHNGPDLFRALFAVAVDYRADGASDFASCLLADLEPPCPLSCREALVQLAAGSWNPSDRLVPFYLITQFGKRELGRAIEALLAVAGPGVERSRLEGVQYWAELSAAVLIAGHLEGRWREWQAGIAEPPSWTRDCPENITHFHPLGCCTPHDDLSE
jgi:hypothetical protein